MGVRNLITEEIKDKFSYLLETADEAIVEFAKVECDGLNYEDKLEFKKAHLCLACTVIARLATLSGHHYAFNNAKNRITASEKVKLVTFQITYDDMRARLKSGIVSFSDPASAEGSITLHINQTTTPFMHIKEIFNLVALAALNAFVTDECVDHLK